MNDKIIKALTIEYEAVYLINLESDTFETLKVLNGSKAMLSSNKWSEASKAFAEECSEDSKPIIRLFADPIYLKKVLSKADNQDCTFRHVSSDSRWRRAYVQIIEQKDNSPTLVLMSVSMIDKLTYQKEKMLQELISTQSVESLDNNAIYRMIYKTENNKLFDGIKILLVDDNDIIRTVSKSILENEGAIVYETDDGTKAVELVTSGNSYDFIIMDIVMPTLDGIEATKQIIEYQEKHDLQIPVIGLTADGSDEQTKEIIKAGAYACLSKPLNPREMSKILISYMKEKSVLMEERMAEIKLLANTDMLTQSGNIVAYTQDIDELAKQINEKYFEVAIVICDLDNLKGINDSYGHDVGDIYIKNCCNLIKRTFGNSRFYRVGGDEFALIVKNQDLARIDELMKALNQQSKELSSIEDVVSGKASVSSGYAKYDAEIDQSLSDTMKRADMAMYDNKMLHKKWNDAYNKLNRR